MFQVGEGTQHTWLDLPRWYEDAACASYPTEWFFLEDTEDHVRVTQAKERLLPGLQVCRRCPVIDQCLEEALRDRSLDVGIRGGMTSMDRRKERRRITRPEVRRLRGDFPQPPQASSRP